jgi:hypothetical protein
MMDRALVLDAHRLLDQSSVLESVRIRQRSGEFLLLFIGPRFRLGPWRCRPIIAIRRRVRLDLLVSPNRSAGCPR